MNKTTKEKQHTVPQFILRNFSDKGRIYTFDKQTGKVYCSNVKDSACERGFYDFETEIGGEKIVGTIEGKLCKIETNASRVIKKILEQDSLVNIADEEKDQVDYFLAAQMIRTQNVKQNYKSMPEQLRNVIRQRMPELANTVNLEEEMPDYMDSDLTLLFDHLIAESTERLRPYLRRLKWILVRTNENNPFLIGDSPVVVFNELYPNKEESLVFSKYSIAFKGACAFFPLSPTRALWLLSPEVLDKYLQSINEELKRCLSSTKIAKDVDKIGELIQALVELEDMFTKTKAVDFIAEYVEKYNYHEIVDAERKVFSKTSDFKKVEAMIKSNDFYRHGKRIEWR